MSSWLLGFGELLGDRAFLFFCFSRINFKSNLRTKTRCLSRPKILKTNCRKTTKVAKSFLF